MNTEKTSFELLFEEGLKHYSLLIRYQCRSWTNSKWDEDELYSEASIVLMKILKFHSELGFKSIHFRNLLMKSIKNRFIDLRRKYYTKSRNQFLEIEWDVYHETVDEGLSSYSSSHVDPEELVSTKQLYIELSSVLSDMDQRMLSQIVNPDDELLKLANERDKAIEQSKSRRSHGSHTEIPVVLLGHSIGLSYKQSLLSLSRIRCAASKIVKA